MKKILSLIRALFARPTEAELIESGIVPTSRRYDRELIDAMQKEAQA